MISFNSNVFGKVLKEMCERQTKFFLMSFFKRSCDQRSSSSGPGCVSHPSRVSHENKTITGCVSSCFKVPDSSPDLKINQLRVS